MKIAIISDIHENFHNLGLALKDIEDRGMEQILCLGDLINPGIAQMLVDFSIPTYMVWGNNDGEKVVITKFSLSKNSHLTVSDATHGFFEADGKRIFMSHYPDIARSMAKSGDYDLVAYGHNHEKNTDKIGNCVVINPGEISAHKTGISSYAIYNTETNEVEIIVLTNIISTRTPEVDRCMEEIVDKCKKDDHYKY
ncbi:metallophosphoesterase [Patescibacteria group bacterium]|nr:metallophosphoesterase [Patescibacteria group bacterium]